MKNKIYILSILFSCFNATLGEASNWQWAKRVGGGSYEGSTSIATDVNGNSYITGLFYGATITFGSTTLNNADNTGNTFDIFIAKFDVNGNVLWAKSAGGTEGELAWSITWESNGNLYLTGYFQSPSLTFGSSTLINTSGGAPSFFIAKYDSSGNALWAKGASGTSYSEGTSISVDTKGNSFVTGWFNSPTITFGSITLSNTGLADDIFIIKYDSSGNVLWAKSAGGGYYDDGAGITSDTIGNLYVTGWFGSPTITFGSIVLTNYNSVTPYPDIFLAKYDSSGNELWAKSVGGNHSEYGSCIITDANGNLFITGEFNSDTLIFGNTTLINSDSTGSNDDVFIAKFDTSGNMLWVKSAEGVIEDYSSGLTIDNNGNVYITGNFLSPDITFGSTTLINVNSSIGFGSSDIFIVKYENSGNLVWAKSAGGNYADGSSGVSIDVYGNLYITGGFESSSISFGGIVLTNAGGGDIFVAKLDNAVGIQEQNNSLNALNIFPNPVTDKLNVTVNDNDLTVILLYDIASSKLLEKCFIHTISLNTEQLAKGIYLYEVRNKDGVIKKGKVVKE